MKRRIILALAALMVFGLAIATVAFSSQTNVSTVTACCCCSGDSCPMKKKDAVAKDASLKDGASCCDGCEHCKGGAESCPMMKDGAHSGEHAKGAHSCCPMMKDAAHAYSSGHDTAKHGEHHDKSMTASCPMKDRPEAKATGEAVATAPVAAADAKGCSCACCQGHAKKQAAPAV